MNKKKKDFFQELRDRNVWRAALLYYKWGKQEKAKEHLTFSLEIWKNADDDYVFANMAKATAQEWKIKILN